MLAIPRIEVRGGVCVHPAGESGAGTALGDPLAVARTWAMHGFRRIHLTDGDAIAGTGSNSILIDEIIRDGAVDVQVCDAAQSSDRIEQVVTGGAIRVVVGPRGLEEPDWLSGAAELYPGLLIVATDVRERRVVTRGWVRSMPVDVLDLVGELNCLPLGGLLVSPGAGDAGRGFDLSLLEDIAEASEFPLIADGGISTMNDLRALEHRGVSAVLLGGALYSGELDARHVAMEFGE
ncbi:MAG TPA: HisA/HisF-related TIM barrel protein [Gemmatimonadaceae bacterium]